MDQQTMIAEMEARAQALGISISQLCASADVHPTTFSRWKLSDNNPAPIGANLQTLGRLDAALRSFEASQDRAA
jgi:hypothetical protein